MESKTLHLTLKKKWFDMILSGEKKEEYRDIKNYYDNRFIDRKEQNKLDNKPYNLIAWKKFDTVTFKNGYAKNAPVIVIQLLNINIDYGLSTWGAVIGQEYYVLSLGEIISTKNIK